MISYWVWLKITEANSTNVNVWPCFILFWKTPYNNTCIPGYNTIRVTKFTESKALSTPIWIFLDPQHFLSWYSFRPHASSESRYFLIRSPEWKIINMQQIWQYVDGENFNPERKCCRSVSKTSGCMWTGPKLWVEKSVISCSIWLFFFTTKGVQGQIF